LDGLAQPDREPYPGAQFVAERQDTDEAADDAQSHDGLR
jgi:hypothetical protein